jgi:hypothetical protein
MHFLLIDTLSGLRKLATTYYYWPVPEEEA